MKRKVGLIVLIVALVLPTLASGLYAAAQRGQTAASLRDQPGGTQSLYLPLVTEGLTPVIPDTTVVLDEATLDDLLSVSADGATFTFADDSPALDALDANDVMVGDVSAAAPYGFLRKVSTVTEQPSGQVVVTTSQATLEEAIQDGAFSVSQTLSPDDVEVAYLAEGVSSGRRPLAPETEFYIELQDVVLLDEDGNLGTTSDQMRATGSLTIEPSYDFSLVIQDWELQTLYFSLSAEETAELELQTSVEWTFLDARKELARYYLTSITVFVGPVPVVLVPVLTVYVGAEGSVEIGVTASVTQQTTLEAGLQYRDGQWQPIGENTTTFSHQPPTLFGSLELRGYIEPPLSLMLYGVAGPESIVQGYLELEANTSQTPWWELYAGIDATAKVKMEVLSWRIESPALQVIGVRQLIAAADTPPPDSGGTTTRVSVASDGTQGNNPSLVPSLSADGRYVAFKSDAANLVSDDTNGAQDVFVHDRQTGETTRVSVASDGTQANDRSYDPAISADGRYVAFWSMATNLVSGDTNGKNDIFVYDRQTGQTTRVSVASDGTLANDRSYDPAISADGRYVTFRSGATNLVSGDTNDESDVFVRDLQTGQTTRVSVASNGTQANSWSDDPAISADGRYVAFWSIATNLVSGDTNGYEDVFVHDRQTGQTTRVSLGSNGTQANDYSWYSTISADGRYVAFQSAATNLVSGDTNNNLDVFIHDRETGQTMRVSVASDGTQTNGLSYDPAISGDGRYVAFWSYATNLVGGDANGDSDVFMHDRQTGQTTRFSLAMDGTQANAGSHYPALSADGRYVAFQSSASNLVSGDTNGVADVFVHDRGEGLR